MAYSTEQKVEAGKKIGSENGKRCSLHLVVIQKGFNIGVKFTEKTNGDQKTS